VYLCIGSSLRLPLKPQLTHTLTRSKLSSREGAGPIIPLQGNLTFWGEYFTTIGLGSPAQDVQLQIDTGSSDLLVYSKGCTGCGNPVHFYDSNSSKTSQYIYCNDDRYGCSVRNCDGLEPCLFSAFPNANDFPIIYGNVINDYMTIGSYKTTGIYSIGSITYISNEFLVSGVDGIWGLAFNDLATWGETPTIQLLIDELKVYNSFDMCMLVDGGVMAIGDDYSTDPRFQWTPVNLEEWYFVTLDDWLMGGKTIDLFLDAYGVVVDSGTTLLVVNDEIFLRIHNLLTSNCTENPLVGVCNVTTGQGLFDGKCVNLTQDQVAAFPVLTLKLKGTLGLNITGFDYLFQGTGVPGEYCLGIKDLDQTIPVIIGDIFLQAFHVVFDRQKDLLGFGPLSSCPPS
jgi:hypothetical protein